MISRLSTLLREEKGTSLIEFALLAPILATIVVGIVDLSSAYSAKLKLEQGAQRAVEKIQRFGFNSSGKTDPASLKSEAAAGAGVDVSKVTVTFWLECDGVEVDYDTACTSGPFARFVEVQVQGTYSPMFSMKWAGANANGSLTIYGRAGIRSQ